MRIAHFGTFDVANYGDLLLARVLERRIGDLGEIVHVSPTAGPPVWDDAVTTISVEAALAEEFDAIVLGGGNILHPLPAQADGYLDGAMQAALGYPSLWAGAAFLSCRDDVPLCWNAPGVPGDFDAAAAPLIAWATSATDYAAVRDVHSLGRLIAAGIARQPAVVPDTAVEVSGVWSRDELAAAFRRLCEERGRDVPPRTVAIHVSPRHADVDEGALARHLDRIAARADAVPVLLGLGPCHGDDRLVAAIAAAMESDPIAVRTPGSISEVAAAIAQSRLYLGSSLHGMISACSFGTPAAAVVDPELAVVAKHRGFLALAGMPDALLPGWRAAEKAIDSLLDRPPASWDRSSRLLPAVDRHWADLRDALLEDLADGAKRRLRKRFADLMRPVGAAAVVPPTIAHDNVERMLALQRRKLSAKAQEADGRAADVAGLREVVSRQEAEIERARADVVAHGAERVRYEERAEGLRRTVEAAERRAATAEEQVRASDEELGQLRARLEESAREARRGRQAQARVEAAERALWKATDESASHAAEARQLLRDLESARARERRAARRASEAEQLLERVETSRAELEDELSRARASLERLSAQAADVDALRSDVAARAADAQAARAELAEERRKAATAQGALADLELRVEDAARRRERLSDEAAAHVERMRQSRSFRHGHRFFRLLSRLMLRRPGDGTALDRAADAIEALRGVDSSVPATFGATAAEATPKAATDGGPRSSGKAPEAAPLADESAAALAFRERYGSLWRSNGRRVPAEADLARPLPRDSLGMLAPAAADSEPEHPGVDVVVCVRDAPDDVRLCLWSLLHYATRPFHLIVVDDGSQPQTATMLDELAEREPAIELLRNAGPEHGYTRAANIGLRGSTGAYAILLNSDTVVTPGWIERIVACGESDGAIGIVGPVSNAATHQSIPAVTDGSGWAVNAVPPWLTPEAMALLVDDASPRARPRVPFVNGFCYAIRREAIDRVGLFDEERFGSGYCEENDLSLRAGDAGFSLAIADDAYVFHAKSRSYTTAGRDEVARRNYRLFLDKHGEERVKALVAELEHAPALDDLRRATARATADPDATVAAFRKARPDPLGVLFVLHGMSEGSSGGGHSIYQEVSALQRLGVPARVALAAKGMDRARRAYEDAERVFAPFEDERELARLAADADVVVATHFTTVAMVERLLSGGADFLPAYYVQDYEPFFVAEGGDGFAQASGSYTAIAGQLLFAKTHWLANLVAQVHGVPVAKVEPSLDGDVFSTEGRLDRSGGPLRVAAMVRPRTPRRQPATTVGALSDVAARGDVEVTTFGCPPDELRRLGLDPPGEHAGILSRTEVADLLRRCDVFLDASVYQAFGRTALEAMACGCTAVAPAIGGATEIVRDGHNGLLADTSNRRSIVAAVRRLADAPELTRQLQRAAVEDARRYSTLKAALSEYALFERAVRLYRDRPPSARLAGDAASTGVGR